MDVGEEARTFRRVGTYRAFAHRDEPRVPFLCHPHRIPGEKRRRESAVLSIRRIHPRRAIPRVASNVPSRASRWGVASRVWLASVLWWWLHLVRWSMSTSWMVVASRFLSPFHLRKDVRIRIASEDSTPSVRAIPGLAWLDGFWVWWRRERGPGEGGWMGTWVPTGSSAVWGSFGGKSRRVCPTNLEKRHFLRARFPVKSPSLNPTATNPTEWSDDSADSVQA